MALHTLKGILLVAVCVCMCLKVDAIEQIDNCPPIDKNIRCFWFNQKCKSNSDCSNGQICCAHACGTDCIDPTGLNNMPRPGVCPAPKPVALDFCARTLVLSNCRQDSDCKDRTQKCCPVVCGALQCTTPITGNRPGCPAINLDLRCIVFNQQCNSDRDCENGRLCCYQPNCGTTCNNPGPNTKPGRCPKTDPNRVCTLQVRPGDCIDDSSCPADKKCCRVGCNRVCVNPEPECGPVCLIYCPFGNVLDGRGCPTCTCKTGCKNEVKPLASINCGSGRTRCPGAYTCVSAASGDFGVCCPLERKCGPVCAIYCPFGNVLDAKGCPTCKCKTGCTNEVKPLESVNCGSGGTRCPGAYRCVSAPSRDFGVCCLLEPVACLDCCGDPPCCNRCDKPGTCPAVKPGQVGTCAEECNLDIDCPGNKKCCSNGCGHVCRDPAGTSTVKDGECPALPPGTIGACVELCSGDSSCPGSQKCCSNGCGHVCKNPAGTSTVKDGECPALPPGTIGACVELCSGDSSCPGSQKCCSNGCGHVCKDPVNTNEGVMK